MPVLFCEIFVLTFLRLIQNYFCLDLQYPIYRLQLKKPSLGLKKILCWVSKRFTPILLLLLRRREKKRNHSIMAQAVEEWYKQMPIITRSYLTAAIVTTIGCSLEIISPHNLYLHPILVVKNYQIWRLVTNFLYFRKMDLDFLFHMFFLARYCKLLEENSFRGRTADFFYMLLFGATVLTGIVLVGGMIPYLSESFSKIFFLSNSLTFMMVYVWSKQNPFIHMSFLGLFTFTAAYLPWVLLGFSVLVGASAWVDLLGMIAGHAYYFLEVVYPQMTGRRPLRTPSFIKSLFADDAVVVARPANVRFAPPPAEELRQD